jgi:thiol-disulfide isomerase/thioredoxin
MKTIKVEVISVSPPCARCKKTEENTKKAAAKLANEGIKIEVIKINVTSKETISKYGVLTSPVIAVNGVVKFMGKVSDARIIEKLAREGATN